MELGRAANQFDLGVNVSVRHCAHPFRRFLSANKENVRRDGFYRTQGFFTDGIAA